MRAAPVPANEAGRLAALRALDLLDTQPEERFDRIARAAAAAFDAPMALVTLVDEDRQWFKSCVGVDMSGTSRDVAFCPYAIAADSLFVVEDATQDPTFADNPLVTGDPHIRFYAGEPIHSPDGFPLGTLCVLDTKPRSLAERDAVVLRSLARWVEDEIAHADVRDLARELEEMRRRSDLILESAAHAMCGLDDDGTIVFVNEATVRLTGFAREELIGNRLHPTLHHTRADGSPYPWDECPTYRTLVDGKPRTVPVDTIWRRDGSPVAVEWWSTAIWEGDAVVGAVVSLNDISERVALENMKNEFVSVVSHELRTPLTSIRGSLGLLAAGVYGDVAPEGKRMLDIAVDSTDRLVRLINDILDLERLESGGIELDPRTVDLGPIIEQSAEASRAVADAAGVALEVHAVAAPVVADPDRMTQVLINLIGNAVKFSPSGTAVEVVGEVSTDRRIALVRVVDRGRGIPADRLDRIFERFVQVDASDRRERGGTGLGLPIARSIVERHHGTLTVESEVGRGSVFTVTLPLAEDRAAAAPTNGQERAPVLVVEDDVALVEVLLAALGAQNIAATAAPSEEAAADQLAAHVPDVVVLDLGLDQGDGFAVLDRLRALPGGESVPVLVYSVRTLGASERRRLQAARVEFMSKGLVDVQTVVDRVRDLVTAAVGS